MTVCIIFASLFTIVCYLKERIHCLCNETSFYCINIRFSEVKRYYSISFKSELFSLKLYKYTYKEDHCVIYLLQRKITLICLHLPWGGDRSEWSSLYVYLYDFPYKLKLRYFVEIYLTGCDEKYKHFII